MTRIIARRLGCIRSTRHNTVWNKDTTLLVTRGRSTRISFFTLLRDFHVLLSMLQSKRLIVQDLKRLELEGKQLPPFEIHDGLRDIRGTKFCNKLLPGNNMSLSFQILKTFPPNTSLTFQLIGGEVDTVSRTYTKSTEVALYGAEPIISFKGLLGVGEYWRKRADEISKCYTVVRTMFSVLHHTIQKAFISQTVGLDVVENLGHYGRWQKFLFSIVVSSTANRTTSTSRHPEEKK